MDLIVGPCFKSIISPAPGSKLCHRPSLKSKETKTATDSIEGFVQRMQQYKARDGVEETGAPSICQGFDLYLELEF